MVYKHWRFSKFAIAIPTKKGNLMLCNAFWGSLAKIKPQRVQFIWNAIHSGISDVEAQNPLLATLIDQGFFVSHNQNESEDAEIMLSREEALKGAHFIILPNLSCNFRCQYCYENLSNEFMSPLIASALRHYIQRNLKKWHSLSFSLYGGEPLLSIGTIFNLLKQISEDCINAGVIFNSDITTNGYLLDKQTALELISHNCKTIQITVDGPPEIHDQKRILRNGEKSYDVLLRNILDLNRISESFKAVIRINFDNGSLPFLPPWLESIKRKLRYDKRFEFSFHKIWNHKESKYPKFDLNCCSENNSLDEINLYSYEDAYKLIKRASPNGDLCCASLKDNFVILPSGKVLKCTAMIDQPLNHVGKLTTAGDIVFNKNIKIWEHFKIKSNKCNECWYYPACRGTSCPGGALIGGMKDIECPTTKEIIPKLLKYYF